MTNLQRIRMIEEALEADIRPALTADRGDIELVDVEGTKVTVGLRGRCAGCPVLAKQGRGTNRATWTNPTLAVTRFFPDTWPSAKDV